MLGRVTSKNNRTKKKSEEKNSCTVNCTVGPTNCIRLNGKGSHFILQSNFLVQMESPFKVVFSRMRKMDIFPYKTDTFCALQLHHGHW